VLEAPLYAADVPAASGGRGAALLGACAAGLFSFGDIAGPLAPPAALVAEPDAAMVPVRAERHARYRQVISALKPIQGTPGTGSAGRPG
jgi:hypothetical protein